MVCILGSRMAGLDDRVLAQDLSAPHTPTSGPPRPWITEETRLFRLRMGKPVALRTNPLRPWQLSSLVLEEMVLTEYGSTSWMKYETLIALLEALLNRTRPIAKERNVALPPLPMGGCDTRYVHYSFSANDFEILAACFRREVEYFLLHHFLLLYPSQGEGQLTDRTSAKPDLRIKSKGKGIAPTDHRETDSFGQGELTPRQRDPPPHFSVQPESVSQAIQQPFQDYEPRTPSRRRDPISTRQQDRPTEPPESDHLQSRSQRTLPSDTRGTTSLIRLFRRTSADRRHPSRVDSDDDHHEGRRPHREHRDDRRSRRPRS